MARSMHHWGRWSKGLGSKLAILLMLALVMAACTPSAPAAPAAEAAAPAEAESEGEAGAGMGGSAVGFIFVGPGDDFGYNQAAFIGSEAVAEAFPRQGGVARRECAGESRSRACDGEHDPQRCEDHLPHLLWGS